MINPSQIDAIELFLAMALLLEEESAERYDELADNMAVHHNPVVEQLFRQMARYGLEHADEVRQCAAGRVLPTVYAWDFRWEDPEGPETTAHDATDYRMSEQAALKLALHNEQRGQLFYASVAQGSPSHEVRDTAARFAAEEAEHVVLVQEWLERVGLEQTLPDDMDPPNMPE